MKALKELRKARGITQTELCKAIKIAQPTLCGYENGLHEPDMETLLKIADFFDVSVDSLFGRDEITPTERAAGVREFKKVNITADEDELLYLFRCLSEPLQDSLLTVARTLAGQSGESGLHKKA